MCVHVCVADTLVVDTVMPVYVCMVDTVCWCVCVCGELIKLHKQVLNYRGWYSARVTDRSKSFDYSL